jgi:hypothetical protein
MVSQKKQMLRRTSATAYCRNEELIVRECGSDNVAVFVVSSIHAAPRVVCTAKFLGVLALTGLAA